MNKLSCAIAFVAGAAVGSVATWFLVKTRYEKRAQEEIDSVKETFANHFKNKDGNKNDEPVDEDEFIATEDEVVDEKEACQNIIREHNYTSYANEKANVQVEAGEEVEPVCDPYVITPQQFMSDDEYEVISLTYFSDGVLVDDDNQVITNVDDIVGTSALSHFGEYEDDSVYVRNERLKCDYEILFDQRRYSNVSRKKPHQVDD